MAIQLYSILTLGVVADDDIEDEIRHAVEISARLLYGLIHARWIITSRGLSKMVSSLIYSTRAASKHLSLVREVQKGGLRALSACALRRTTPPPHRIDRHTLRKGRKTLLPPLRRPVLPQIIPPWLHRRRLLRLNVPSYAIHGISADDPQSAGAG